MKKSLLALALSVAAVSGAHASYWSGVSTTGNTNIGNGEMFLVLWDDVAKNSYIQDTGILFSDLQAGTVNSTIALDSAALNTAFGGNYANVKWAVGAASNHYTDAPGEAYETLQFGLFTSGSATSFPGQETDGEAQILSISGRSQIFQTIPAIAGGAFQQGTQADNGVDVSVNNAPDYMGGTNLASPFVALQGALSVASAVNQTTNLWYYGFNDNDALSPVTEIRGQLSLNVNGSNGELILAQAPVSEVPVPAAAWLMGSALVGLGGVARSRKKA